MQETPPNYVYEIKFTLNNVQQVLPCTANNQPFALNWGACQNCQPLVYYISANTQQKAVLLLKDILRGSIFRGLGLLQTNPDPNFVNVISIRTIGNIVYPHLPSNVLL